MKYLPSQIFYFFRNKTTQRNMVLLAKFFIFLSGIITIYSVLFHVIMLYEGKEYSWITGFYWALTVMSTLGFGDITFSSDLGLVFTILVLASGVVFLLIMLPFSFIQFFYAPWLEAQERSRAPRELPKGTKGHIILTNLDPITEKLIQKLNRRQYEYVIIAPDQNTAIQLHDSGYNVVVGEQDDPETFKRLCIADASMVVITNDDLMNTNIAFTIRGITKDVPIVTNANHEHSLDILNFPGNITVFQFMRMLGHGLAERTIGLGTATSVITNFDTMQIAEISASRTALVGKVLSEIGLRQQTGITIIGLWEKGRFEAPDATTPIRSSTVLLLAGTKEQLHRFESIFVPKDEAFSPDIPVLILGGGRVGLAAAEKLEEHGIRYTIVEKRASFAEKNKAFVKGDAADINVLKQAGINEARTIIVTTHNDAMNIYLTFYCRQLRPDIQLVSRATNERSVSKLHMAGADLVLSYASLGANGIINVLNSDEITMFTEGLNIFSQPIPSSLAGKTLVESGIRPMTGCSVVATRTAGKLNVSPDPNIPLKKNDELILIGTTEAEKEFAKAF